MDAVRLVESDGNPPVKEKSQITEETQAHKAEQLIDFSSEEIKPEGHEILDSSRIQSARDLGIEQDDSAQYIPGIDSESQRSARIQRTPPEMEALKIGNTRVTE